MFESRLNVLCVCDRLVNTVLAKELETIHAFSQKSLTEEQYEKQKDSL